MMITTRLIIFHTGRQTMGIESHQEPSGLLLSEKCVTELHFVSFSCWSSYFRNEPFQTSFDKFVRHEYFLQKFDKQPKAYWSHSCRD